MIARLAVILGCALILAGLRFGPDLMPQGNHAEARSSIARLAAGKKAGRKARKSRRRKPLAANTKRKVRRKRIVRRSPRLLGASRLPEKKKSDRLRSTVGGTSIVSLFDVANR
jgi:hypothetical protein